MGFDLEKIKKGKVIFLVYGFDLVLKIFCYVL